MNNISHSKIVSYQSDWPIKFQAEKEILQNVFRDKLLAIEHIGSTAIPGLSSKDIIDIAVMIENNEDADYFTELLKQLRYKIHSISAERHFYTKGDPIEYHLSIAYAKRGGFWPRQIMFRDYLRNHPEALEEYQKLKLDLLKKDPTGKGEYIAGKNDFVQEILRSAGWREQTYEEWVLENND